MTQEMLVGFVAGLLPAFAGLYWVASAGDDRFRRLAGWLAFKPVLATPLFLALLFAAVMLWQGAGLYPILLPGAGITLLLLWRFRRALSAWVAPLVLLDAARWLVSFSLMHYVGHNPPLPLYWAAVTLPVVFVLTTWGLLALRGRR